MKHAALTVIFLALGSNPATLSAQELTKEPVLTAPQALAQSPPTLKTETFDRDPGWEGIRNHIAREQKKVKQQDFGFQQSNYAGAKAGEMDGVIWRDIAPAYDGKKIAPLTFDDAMSCSGSLSLAQSPESISGYQVGATIFVGFFNHQEQGCRPINFLGFRLEGWNEPDGATLEVSYGTSQWTAAGAFVNTLGRFAGAVAGDDASLAAPLDGPRARADHAASHGAPGGGESWQTRPRSTVARMSYADLVRIASQGGGA